MFLMKTLWNLCFDSISDLPFEINLGKMSSGKVSRTGGMCCGHASLPSNVGSSGVQGQHY